MDEGGRADAELVRRGLARSRGAARELIDRGVVTCDGIRVAKPAQPVHGSNVLAVAQGEPRWVGRAAGKLAAAISGWRPQGLTVQGRRALDVGASTGGFTQVLLHEGATSVVALDVGHGQLAPVVRDDPRVVERSGCSIRDVQPHDVGAPFDVIVADLSFISLALVVPQLTALGHRQTDLIVLVKPQFEVGRQRLGKRGVVTDPAARRSAVTAVRAALEEHGWGVRALTPSPIVGTTGNVEYLVWAVSDPSVMMDSAAVDLAVANLGQEDCR